MTKVSHAMDGDRTTITVEFARSSILAIDEKTVKVTLTDQHWFDVGKRVLREFNIAEREMDQDAVAARAAIAITEAVERGMRGVGDPEIMRRRGVAGALHRIAELVMSGTVRAFDVGWKWSQGDRLGVRFETRAKTKVISVSLLPPAEISGQSIDRPTHGGGQ